MSALYTIGYEQRGISDFLSVLKGHGITRVVDVRQYPNSRRPGFSKSALTRLLSESGIAYESLPALGSPIDLRKAYRLTGDVVTFFKQYQRYLETQDEALAYLLSLAHTQQCCLLCYERDADECHRKIIAEFIQKMDGNSLEICHL